MVYAIQTLEIEIARIRQALRVASTTNVSYTDTQEGYPVNYEYQQSLIRQLNVAIETLRQWEIDNPLEEGHLRSF